MNVCEQFHKLLADGVGKISDIKIKLHIDPPVQPVSQRHRRIPFHVRKDVEAELDRLEKLDIIEKADGPTPWVSPTVVVPKADGGVRLCVDNREPIKAIKREKHIMPTLDDLISDRNRSTVFSKLDLSNAYHQLELDEASRQVTTFTTFDVTSACCLELMQLPRYSKTPYQRYFLKFQASETCQMTSSSLERLKQNTTAVFKQH